MPMMEPASVHLHPPANDGRPERLSILLVSSSSGSQGGGELYLVGLAEKLQAMGHDVTALVASHPRMDALATLLGRWVPVERLEYVNTYDRRLRSGGAVFDRRGIARLAARFRRRTPDLIHLNQQNVEDGLDLLLAADRSGMAWVSTIHIARSMASLGARGGRFRDWLSRSVLRRVGGHFIAIADACLEDLRRQLGGRMSPSRLHRVHNGVAEVPPGDRQEVRRQWGCCDGEVVLGCVARIEAQKNPLLLVRLLPLLPPHVRLVWVGDGRLRPLVLEEAARRGVADRVHVDGWRSDARQRMSGFDLYVLPSQFEGLPLALLEAMAAGLPCVVSAVDGVRDVILDGATGRLCPPGDLQAWLDALCPLIESREHRDRLGQNARRLYEERFSLEAMARGTVEVYRKVLEEGSGFGPQGPGT
jgi:glycosyltransferase involved in cell wall biosynthesis